MVQGYGQRCFRGEAGGDCLEECRLSCEQCGVLKTGAFQGGGPFGLGQVNQACGQCFF